MKLTIPGRLPGMNEIVAAAKSHPKQYSGMKRKHTQDVAILARSLPHMERVDVQITWICENKRRDQDNISGGGTKFVLDGLQAAGVIDNDGWKQINSITHKFAVDKNNPRIEVELTEISTR